MANSQNLVPKAHTLTVDEQSKGGKRSGEVRRERQRLRGIAQAVLSGTYTDENGEQLTGEQLITKNLIEIISDKNSRYFMDVLKLLISLTNADLTDTECQLKDIKAETALKKAEYDYNHVDIEIEQQERWDNAMDILL